MGSIANVPGGHTAAGAWGKLQRIAPDSDVATRGDVDALREEVRALREAISPAPSPLILGAEVRRAYAALRPVPGR